MLLLQSSLYSETWLDFPGNRTITVQYPANFLNPIQWTAYVSTGPNQEAGATATEASGELAEFTDSTATGFQLHNASCTDYFVYFTVLGTALPPLNAGTDAGFVTDAGTVGDASRD